jgi:MFS family permease
MTGSKAVPAFAETIPTVLSEVSQDWRRGWPVVVAGLFGYMMVSLGMMSMGAFMGPVQRAFHWTRSEYSSGLSVYAVVGVLLAPLVGMLIDWRGPRLVAVAGALLAGVTFSLFGTVNSSLVWWLVLWVMFASACQLIMPTLWSAAIAGVFTVSRGLAMSLALAGAALAGFIMPIMANLLIEHFGFRTAYVAMGLGFGSLVAAIGAAGMPGRLGRTNRSSAEPDVPAPALPGLTLAQGLRSSSFVKLAVAMLVANAVIYALAVHIIPLLTGAGLARDTAVMLAGILGLTSLAGKLVCGVAMDRYSGRLVASGFILLLIGGLAMLALPSMTLAWAIVAVLLTGLPYGALAPVFPYLVSRYFGLRAYGRLFGMLSSFYAIALATGPLLAGYVHDATHSYLPFLLGGIPALLLAILMLVSLGPYPDFSEPGARPTRG